MLLINKPKGWTSFDAVAYIRNRVGRQSIVIPSEARADEESLSQSPNGQRSAPRGIFDLGGVDPTRDDKRKRARIKVGHAGTLDPFATGLLIIAVGREETKKLDEFKNLPKTYIATLRLGATSDTMDATGVIQKSKKTRKQENKCKSPIAFLLSCFFDFLKKKPTRTEVEDMLNSFKGSQLQTPPMFSAKSIGGVRLYKLARKGVEVERQPNEIEILDIKLLEYSYPLLKIEVTCTAGTYIRTLAHDIGQKLGTGAYCEELMRTRIGDFKLEDAQELSAIDFNQK